MQHSKPPHVYKLMRHCGGGKAYAEGGDIGRSGMAVGGGLPSVQFGRGGRACHRDAGGSMNDATMKGNKPLTSGLSHGGKASHRRHHRSFGGTFGNIANGAAHFGRTFHKKGGHCYKRKMAMGGVGKLRKGVM